MSQQGSPKDSPDYWIDEINKIILTDPLSPESRERLENLKAYLFELSDLAASQTASNDRRQKYDLKLKRGLRIKLRKESYKQNYRDWAAALVCHLNEPSKEEARQIRKAIRDRLECGSDEARNRYNEFIRGKPSSLRETDLPIPLKDLEPMLWKFIERFEARFSQSAKKRSNS